MTQALPRLLLVDDEPNLIAGISRRLRTEYEIFSANSAAEALRVLEQQGAMNVIMSDMRMPVMSGAALLAETCKLYPDMVRMLLTGQADVESAIMAVNEGQIFRFLLKPCATDLLRVHLKAACRLHELVTGERVLLEQTLKGAVTALSEVLSWALPEAFGKATRVRQRASKLATRMGIQDVWQIEVAATLSQVGAVTLSPETATKLYRSQPLSAEEQAAVNRLPAIAVELLKHIPRLESVRELITLGSANESVSIPRSREAQVLRACVEYDSLQDTGLTTADALASMGRRPYDPELLTALGAMVADETTCARVVEVALSELREGMVLAEDLYGATGTLLLARGYSVKTTVIERLRAMRPNLGGRQMLRVTLSKSTPKELS